MHRLRTIHLFAGAGGGVLADLLLGHQPICVVEIDGYCQQVLSARQKDNNLPWFPIFDDVTTFDGKPWRGLVDIVAGGFPCQDISAAGKGEGITGERSGLWVEMARIIGEVRPRYAFVENSPVLTSRGLGMVLGDLAAMGFDARWGVLGAADVGAPHLRTRIWIKGTREEKHDSNALRKRKERQTNTKQCFEFDEIRARLEQRRDELSCTDTNGLRELQPERGKSNEWRWIGDGGWWETEPDVGRVVNGLAARVDRLKALGNGQVPQCAAEAWRILSE